MAPAMTAFRRLGNGLALVPPQRLDGQPRPPQIGLGHRDGGLGQHLSHAVIAQHLGGTGRGQLLADCVYLWLPNISSGRIRRDSEGCDMISIHDWDHESVVVDLWIAAQVA